MVAKIKTGPRQSPHRHRQSHKPKGVSHHDFRKVYWPYIPVILIIGMLLSLTTKTGALSSMINHPSGRVLAYATSMSINGLLHDTNAARAQHGVSALGLNSKLDAAAQAKANDMAKRNYWSHNTPEGKSPWTFVIAQGYSYQKLGENLAAGFDDEQSTIDGWMASAPHRQNLLDSAFSDVGFGYANNPNYTSAGGGPMTIVVAFYGKPQVLAKQTTTAKNTTPAQTPARAPIPAVQTTTPKTTKHKSSKKPTVTKKPQPATTQTTIKPAELAASPSRAQIALANLPIAKIGTSLALIGMLSALIIWLGRHALSLRRMLLKGEKYAFQHPLMDIGLLIIAALSYLLSQTAGFIQ